MYNSTKLQFYLLFLIYTFKNISYLHTHEISPTLSHPRDFRHQIKVRNPKMKRKLVSSYLLNANWYVILMHCNNTHDTRQIPEPSSPAHHPACFFLTTDTGSGLSCKVVRLPLDAAAQAFIFLINFNARKNFQLAPCAIYMPHLCICMRVFVCGCNPWYGALRRST